MAAPAVSIVILTYNEEGSIEACLESVRAFADVHVLDSGSTDATTQLASRLGASVHQNPFVSFGNQRNWAIDNVPVLHPWVLHLDADERMTPELASEMASAVDAAPSVGGFWIPSKMMFGNRWLKHAGDYPNYQVRLFHKDRLRFVDYGHGQREKTDYPLAKLKEGYLHYPFLKGLDNWFAKHAGYARQEAAQAFEEVFGPGRAVRLREVFFTRDRTRRRRALKQMAYRLPCRYLFRLFYMLFVKRAFLDGAPGLIYAMMLATYESMIEVHLRLLKRGIAP